MGREKSSGSYTEAQSDSDFSSGDATENKSAVAVYVQHGCLVKDETMENMGAEMKETVVQVMCSRSEKVSSTIGTVIGTPMQTYTCSNF